MPTKPTTIDAYLATLPSTKRETLEKLRQVIRKALPDAEEVISYSMPAFRQEGIVAWFAAAKNHYAVYVYPGVKSLFAEDLRAYQATKSAIHFSYDEPVPVRLMQRIVKESLKQNLAKEKQRKSGRSPRASAK